MSQIQYIRSRLFIDGINCKFNKDNTCKCSTPGCPYRVKVTTGTNAAGKKAAVGVAQVLFGHHWHDNTNCKKESMKDRRRRIEAEALLISAKGPGWEEVADSHSKMEEKVRKEAASVFSELMKKTAEREYALKHPHLSGAEIKENMKSTMTPSAVLVSRKRDMELHKRPTTLSGIVASKYHLILGNVGDDYIVFGTQSSLELLATTPVIQCDGTFSCRPCGYYQLYIFHGLVNNVSYPLVYALVKGKDQKTYSVLFSLVETIAETNGLTIFHRPVDINIDFEKAVMNEMTALVGYKRVHGCYFHFSQSMFRNLGKLKNSYLRGKNKDEVDDDVLVYRLVRCIMALPHLPIVLVTQETVMDIRNTFKIKDRRTAGNVDVFINDYFIKHYVENGCSYPPRFWNVCGQQTRTNNCAESSHNFLNEKVKGSLTPWRFISIIQLQMVNTRKEIDQGCLSHSKAINTEINALLNNELHSLLSGETTTVKYLERCSTIVQLKNQGERARFERIRRNEKDIVPDKMRRRMLNVARKMGEEMNEEKDTIKGVLVFKPFIPANWFARDFGMVEWDDRSTVVQCEDIERTLVVPKDPEKRQAFSRTLSFKVHAVKKRRMPRSHKAIARYVVENLFSRFSEERVEVDFDDDFSLVNDDVTTSFIQIIDRELACQDPEDGTDIGITAPSENTYQSNDGVDCLHNVTPQCHQNDPMLFCLPSFQDHPLMKRFFDPGNLPEPRRNVVCLPGVTQA